MRQKVPQFEILEVAGRQVVLQPVGHGIARGHMRRQTWRNRRAEHVAVDGIDRLGQAPHRNLKQHAAVIGLDHAGRAATQIQQLTRDDHHVEEFVVFIQRGSDALLEFLIRLLDLGSEPQHTSRRPVVNAAAVRDQAAQQLAGAEAAAAHQRRDVETQMMAGKWAWGSAVGQ